MTTLHGGLRQFEDQLSPVLVREALTWRTHPELRKLLVNLESHTDQRTFLNVYAEALVAHHLLTSGCELRFEVPTPGGKHCDFEVARDGATFYLHVKRIETRAPERKRLTVSSRLRVLERIERPYIVSIRWHEGLTDRQMQELVRQAGAFILHARVGDELTIRDPGSRKAVIPAQAGIQRRAEDVPDELGRLGDDEAPAGDTGSAGGVSGRELGGLRILAPWDGSHVTLAIGMPGGFVDESPRMRKLLVRAYQQFMPRAENVILMGASHRSDVDDFDSALLGSHIERWDTHPPRGRRIAHGRAPDGFWWESRYEQSRAAAWFHFAPKETSLESRLWLREGATMTPEVAELIQDLFSNDDSR